MSIQLDFLGGYENMHCTQNILSVNFNIKNVSGQREYYWWEFKNKYV